MDHGDLQQPGRLSARYEHLSGGRAKRLIYYLAQRHLSLSPPEWDRLAWWHQKVYLDGFEEEGILTTREGPSDSTVKSEKVHQTGSTTITEREHSTVFSGQPGEMAAFGIAEQTLG